MPSRHPVARSKFCQYCQRSYYTSQRKNWVFLNPLNRIINSVMETSISYFMTITMIRIINYAVTPPRGPFEILQVLPKGVVHEPEENRVFLEPLNRIINSVMETSIPYFMTIRIIRIINYAVTPPRGPFKTFPVLPKGVVHVPVEKLSIFGTTKSDHKVGHGDFHTIFYYNKND